MLTEKSSERTAIGARGPHSHESSHDATSTTSTASTRLEQALTLEWLGQTLASICWIASVFCYGVNSSGDWLQLAAASSWLLANIATVAGGKAD